MAHDALAGQARQHLLDSTHCILSTQSIYLPGWPFGSVAPFALSEDLEPVLLLSGIAEHSRNVAADPRVSLLCLDPEARDKQASWRLTLLGWLRRTPPEEPDHEALRAAYLGRFPHAADFFQVHDFALYRLSVAAVRFIAGFGSMDWLPVGEVLGRKDDPASVHAQAVIEHMNEDHRSALQDYVRAFFGLQPDEVRLAGVDSRGFDLEALTGGRPLRLRLPFERPARTPDEFRRAAVDLVRTARARLSSV